MKPAQFAYHAPADLDEVVALLAAGRETRVLAGGQSLVPMMNFRLASPEALVDLRRVAEVQHLAVTPAGELVVGAGVTQARLLASAVAARGWPLLAEALRHVGHPQVRNRGTVCGSLAHHDPTAELPAVAVALDARLIVQGPAGRREIPAADFFVSFYETALRADEVLVEVRFPPRPGREGHAFREVARKHGDFALVGAAATVRRSEAGDRVTAARLVLLGVGERACRLPEIEDQLTGTVADPAAMRDLARGVADLVTPVGDSKASSTYRRDVGAELAASVLVDAWNRSGDD